MDIETTHRELVAAQLRIAFGSVAAFERAYGLPTKSVNDVLRGRPNARVKAAISDVLDKSKSPKKQSELSDCNRKCAASHRISGAGK
jgi:GrpB-like predicted nucleotidyltransferase (UPF0157 family)